MCVCLCAYVCLCASVCLLLMYPGISWHCIVQYLPGFDSSFELSLKPLPNFHMTILCINNHIARWQNVSKRTH